MIEKPLFEILNIEGSHIGYVYEINDLWIISTTGNKNLVIYKSLNEVISKCRSMKDTLMSY